MTPKVLTGFTELNDGELDLEAANAVTGLTGNTNFTFSGSDLTDFTEATNAYHSSLGALKTGGQARQLLLPKMRHGKRCCHCLPMLPLL